MTMENLKNYVIKQWVTIINTDKNTIPYHGAELRQTTSYNKLEKKFPYSEARL